MKNLKQLGLTLSFKKLEIWKKLNIWRNLKFEKAERFKENIWKNFKLENGQKFGKFKNKLKKWFGKWLILQIRNCGNSLN